MFAMSRLVFRPRFGWFVLEPTRKKRARREVPPNAKAVIFAVAFLIVAVVILTH